MHPTPLCGPKIAAFLKLGFSSNACPTYQCGAGDAQAVGPPLCNLLLCRSSLCNAIAPYPSRVRNVIARAHLTIAPSRQAQSCAKRHSAMPTSLQRYRGMLTRARNVVAHAHPAATPSRHAQLVCATSSRVPTSPQRRRLMPWSHAKRPRACPSCRNAIAPCLSCAERVMSSGFRHLPTIVFGVVPHHDQVEERQARQFIREGANLIRLGAKLTKEPLQEVG